MTGSLIVAMIAGSSFFLLDQWSKRLAQARLGSTAVAWAPGVRFRVVYHNKSFYQQNTARVLLVLTWIAACFGGMVLYRSGGWDSHPLAAFGLCLALGGAAGNLLDILRWRYVFDFIDLGWWPVFNLADVGIVVGLVLILPGLVG